MPIKDIQIAIDGINKMILKICVVFAITILIVVAGATMMLINSNKSFKEVIINNTNKSYDYEGYPETIIDNINVNGEGNEVNE